VAEVVLSPLAKADMQEIADYISRELRNPSAAGRLIRRFREAMDPLRRFPASGAPLPAAGQQGDPYRYLVCGSYLIFYRIDGDTVRVDRVIYGRRDYMALLFGDELTEEKH
jgi:addiction module RelE/StbE family toxin